MNNLTEIRQKMQKSNLDAYIVTHGNQFIGQDILPSENKLLSLCGFSGSAGMLCITKEKAYLWVDGRYELQARQETDNNLINIIDDTPRFKNVCELLKAEEMQHIGYDAWNHSVAEMEFIKRKYPEMEFNDVGNLTSEPICHKIQILPRDIKFCGASFAEKFIDLQNLINEREADYFLLTSADSVSWLLNIYARDLPYSPIVRAYALISKNGDVKLFGDNLQTEIPHDTLTQLTDFLAKNQTAKILCDAHTTPEKIKLSNTDKYLLIKAADICQFKKAQKNQTELQGMINCHIRDGVALVKFLSWLENNYQGLSEYDITEKLHQFREKQEHFFSESFATIAGFGANGAIVHYQPHKNTAAFLQDNNLLLLDSGAQYYDGTTDVTRTIALGIPTEEAITDFTYVLKAHISLARAIFPVGTPGIKLDILARSQVWQNSADYKHGTGHGVACFGNVHEGPISISSGSSDYGFLPNMITSNEPGIYRANNYGIRIENLQYTQLTQKNTYGDFLNFIPLTKVPIDKHLINVYLLNNGERAWLNDYHQNVYNCLAPYLNEIENIWLKKACSPL